MVSNNRLLQLPDELGRMDKLTELDASCNQITSLPNRMMELRQLRALLLRNNQLVYIPREVTNLQLVTLDVSGNRIGKLPTEMRQMTSLVSLELENNPLTSPPANVRIISYRRVFHTGGYFIQEEMTNFCLKKNLLFIQLYFIGVPPFLSASPN